MAHLNFTLARTMLVLLIFFCSSNSFSQTYKIATSGIAPISTLSKDGVPKGFFNEVVTHILDQNNMRYEFVPCTWSSCIELLRKGEVDIVPGLIKNKDRSLEFDFSHSNLYHVWGEVLSYNENSITDLRMLEGKTVGVVKGVFLNDTFEDVLEVYNIDVTIVTFDTIQKLFSSLEHRKIDAIITNNVFMLGVVGQYSYYHTGIVFSPTDFRLATKTGANPGLMEMLDNSLHQLKRDPTSAYYRLRNKYMSRYHDETVLGLFWQIMAAVVLAVILFSVPLYMCKKNLLPFRGQALFRKEKRVLFSNDISSFEWRSDWDSVKINANDSFFRALFPHSLGTVDKLITFIHPDDHLRIKTSLKEVIVDKKLQQEVEFRIVVQDVTRWANLQGSVVEIDQSGRPIHIIGIVQDITDKKIKYLHEKQVLQQYQTIFETSHIGFWNWNIGDGKMEVNSSYVIMLGYSTDDRSRFSSSVFVEDQIHHEDREKFQVGLNLHLAGTTSIFNAEYRMKRKNGSYLWIHTKGIVLERSNTGLPSSMVGININIDDNKMNEFAILQRERQLNELALKLEENMEKAQSASRLKSSFLANMSHEIRTPLNAVIGMTDVLSETSLDENQKYYVDIVSQAGDNLLALINDILDSSKIEAGELKIDSKEFNVREVTSRAVELIAFRFKDKDIIFSYEINEDVPSKIMGDEYRLYQILVNLLNNAGKFTMEGEVSLCLSRGIVGEKEVLKFEIIDTGIGIPKESLEIVFNVFGQVTNDKLQKIEGTGLGLTISRQLAIMMGGDIGVDSEEGKGSRFYFTIALEPVESFALDQSVLSKLNGKRIALLNNHRIENSIIVTRFERHSCKVVLYYHFDEIDFDRIDFLMLDWWHYLNNNLEEQVVGLNQKYKNKIIMLQPVFYGSDQLNQIHNAGLRNYLHRPLQMAKIDDLLLNRKDATGAGGTALSELSDTVHFKSLLIVDDSDANLELMKVFVGGICDHYDCVKNGALAVEAAMNNTYDLIFMDIQMPVMDGYQATAKIREFEAENGNGNARIIALTAYALKDEVDKIYSSGFDDYLAKPLKKKSLFKCIQKYNKAA